MAQIYLRDGTFMTLAGVVVPVNVESDGDDGYRLSLTMGAVLLPTGAPLVGQKAIAVTGTAVALSASGVTLPSGSVLVYALSTNAAAVVIGQQDVNNTIDGSGNGYILEPGQSVVIMGDDLSAIFVNGTEDDVVTFSAG